MAGRAGRGFCSKVPRKRVFPRRGHGLIWILEGIGGKHAFKKHEVGRGWRGSRAGHGKSHEGQLRASSSSWQGLIGSLGVTWSDLDFRKITLTTGCTRSNPATAITPRVRCALMIAVQQERRLIISQGDKKLDSDVSPPPALQQGGQLHTQVLGARGHCPEALLRRGPAPALRSTQASRRHWALLPAPLLRICGSCECHDLEKPLHPRSGSAFLWLHMM